MLCTYREDLRYFWPSYRQCSRYHITVRQVNMDTHAVRWMNKCFENGKPQFQISRWNSIILNLIAIFSVYSSYYVTTTSFLTLPIHFEVIIVQWTDECWELKKDPGIVFMCGLAVTVKLYRAAIILSDADSHYFQIRGFFHRLCLMSVPLHKNIYRYEY